MTRRSRSREAKTRSSRRRFNDEKRHSKSTCSRRESDGRHSSITCWQKRWTTQGSLYDRSVIICTLLKSFSFCFFLNWTSQCSVKSPTSVPEPGRKFLTVIVLPGAGKGASMMPLIKGCTRAGEMALLFSTSSSICKKANGNGLNWSPTMFDVFHVLCILPRMWHFVFSMIFLDYLIETRLLHDTVAAG